MPDPDLAEISKICIRGRTLSMFRRAAARSDSAASAKSILVMIATSELLKMVEYFNGLSSSSVAESRTKRSSSPRSIAGRADEIADVFNKEEIEVVELPSLERSLDHQGVEMADGSGGDLADVGSGTLEVSGVILSLSLSLQSPRRLAIPAPSAGRDLSAPG